MKRFILKYWLLIFFVIFFLLMFFFGISFDEIWKTFSLLRIWQIAALLGMYFFITFLIVASRKFLLHELSFNCKWKNLFLIHFASMAAHYTTPAKIGFPLAVYLLNERECVPYRYGTVVVLIELTTSIFLCGAISLLGTLVYFDEFKFFRIQLLILSIFLVAGIVFLLIYKMRSKISFLSKYQEIIKSFSMMNYKSIFLYGLFVLLIQGVGSINLLLLCFFFSSSISVTEAITSNSSAFIIGAISMIPMGIGSRDVTLLLYLRKFGVGESVGLSVISTQRILSTGLTFLLGTICGIFLSRLKLKTERSKVIDDNIPDAQV